jgi:CRISPR-associated protein Cas1
MKQLLNTLYVTTQGAYLARERETVLVRVERETRLRLPIHTLQAIVCFGRVACSPALLGLCGQRGVTVSFCSVYGRFLARVQGRVSGNVLLRRAQYRWADDEGKTADIARAIVAAKIANSRNVLLRGAREAAGGEVREALTQAARHMGGLADRLGGPLPLDTVRGIEGDGARAYFGVFGRLVTAQQDEFYLAGRNRRPPRDNMNALLSFLYTLLASDVASALETVGLDPQVGFLHRDRPGRLGLALDLMEELRPVLADRVALSLVNRRQVSGSGFEVSESGAVSMDDKTRKTVLVAYQTRKRDEIGHPFLGEKVALGLLPYVQGLLLARHIRGDLDGYPSFFWK